MMDRPVVVSRIDQCGVADRAALKMKEAHNGVAPLS
jgi:hypothetical protein